MAADRELKERDGLDFSPEELLNTHPEEACKRIEEELRKHDLFDLVDSVEIVDGHVNMASAPAVPDHVWQTVLTVAAYAIGLVPAAPG